MTRDEWKIEYAAARTLVNVRHAVYYTSSPITDRVWDIAYSYITTRMHPSIYVAVFGRHKTAYPLRENKWAAKHNSTCFNRT